MSEQERMSLEQQELASLMEVGEAAWRWTHTKGLDDSLNHAEWRLVEAVEKHHAVKRMQRDAEGDTMRFRNCECETCEFQKGQELDALEADAEQLALVKKLAQDGIDDYLKWAGLK